MNPLKELLPADELTGDEFQPAGPEISVLNSISGLSDSII